MSTQLDSAAAYLAERPPTGSPGSSGGTRILVGSGKGGVGTSTVAALLALQAAAEGEQVLLVDGADAIPSLHLLLGVHPRHELAALRGSGISPEELLVPVLPRLSLLPGGGMGDAALPPAERQALFRRVSALFSRFDCVVFDAGSRLGSVLHLSASGIDRLLAVSTPDRIALAATYALIKAVGERFPGIRTDLLMNRSDPDSGQQCWDALNGAAAHFLNRHVELAGALPDDPSLAAAVGAGMTLPEAADGSPAMLVLQSIGSQLLSVPSPAVIPPV